MGGRACGFVCLWGAGGARHRWPLCLVFKASIFSGTKATLAANPLDMVVRPRWACGRWGLMDGLVSALKSWVLPSNTLVAPGSSGSLCVLLKLPQRGVHVPQGLCKFGTIRSQSGTAWVDFENTSNMKTCLSVPSTLRASDHPQNWAPRSCSAPSDFNWTRCGAWAEFSGT